MSSDNLPTRSAEDTAARAELLQPVALQNEQIRRYYRSRRRVSDVDPETGEPTDGELPLDDDAAEAPSSASHPTGGASTDGSTPS